MGLKAGIIGLPNVGKSTVFNSLTRGRAAAANYAFTTIEPNIGTVVVPDERLGALSSFFPMEKAVPTTFEFIDIAGLVKGAHRGEGLGNQFLSHIREVDALIHVVRVFTDDNVAHVHGVSDPLADISVVEAELMLADLESVSKRLPKIEKKAVLKVEGDIEKEYGILKRCEEALKRETPLRSLDFTPEEHQVLKPFGFLTLKPVLFLANVDEDHDPAVSEPSIEAISTYASDKKADVLVYSARLEDELSELESDERRKMLEELELASAGGLETLIEESLALLGLKTFYTVENKLHRAWLFRSGMRAPECAGIIHSDFEKGFIRAETIHFDDLVAAGSYARAKETGKIRSEGKQYEVRDGDIITFRFNT